MKIKDKISCIIVKISTSITLILVMGYFAYLSYMFFLNEITVESIISFGVISLIILAGVIPISYNLLMRTNNPLSHKNIFTIDPLYTSKMDQSFSDNPYQFSKNSSRELTNSEKNVLRKKQRNKNIEKILDN